MPVPASIGGRDECTLEKLWREAISDDAHLKLVTISVS